MTLRPVDLNDDPINKSHMHMLMLSIKELRKLALQERMHPYIVRQVLLMALEIDTLNALQKVTQTDLDKFDRQVRTQVRSMKFEP